MSVIFTIVFLLSFLSISFSTNFLDSSEFKSDATLGKLTFKISASSLEVIPFFIKVRCSNAPVSPCGAIKRYFY